MLGWSYRRVAFAIVLRSRAVKGSFYHLLSQQFLQLGILSLMCFQLLGVGNSHATILGPPLIKRGATGPVLAKQLLRTKPSLMLLQYPNDLFFAETASLHCLCPSCRAGQT